MDVRDYAPDHRARTRTERVRAQTHITGHQTGESGISVTALVIGTVIGTIVGELTREVIFGE